jgi:5-formyltetrahydrofolate cyclo-ligase
VTNATDKPTLRSAYLARRQAIPADERARRSAAIVRVLTGLVAAEAPSCVALYLPARGEVDVAALCGDVDVPLAAPVVDASGRGMAFRRMTTHAPLVPNRFGILEPGPAAPSVALDERSIVLVPCLAVDRRGVRLGYGGGFYDAFLGGSPARARAIAVVYREFLVPTLPAEAHDVRLTRAVTEDGVVSLGDVDGAGG